MSTFVSAYGNRARGYPLINLDHVVTLRQSPSDSFAWLAFNAADEEIGTVAKYSIPDARPVLPNHVAISMHAFWEDGDAEYPIVGWRVDEHTVEPLMLEDDVGDSDWCYVWQGRYIFPEDRTLATLAEAQSYVRELQAKRRELAQAKSTVN